MNKIDPNVYEEVNLDDSDYNCSVDFEHMRMIRPWGHYEILASGPGYLVKRITVDPGKRTSLQWHAERDETWVQVSQIHPEYCPFLIGGYLWNSQFLEVPQGEYHRISNVGTEPLVIIEVQTSEQADDCREDDIHRIEDDYGREVDEE